MLGGIGTAVVDASFPVDQSATALRYVADGKANGKVVLHVGRPN